MKKFRQLPGYVVIAFDLLATKTFNTDKVYIVYRRSSEKEVLDASNPIQYINDIQIVWGYENIQKLLRLGMFVNACA